jgi:hypothetical protein
MRLAAKVSMQRGRLLRSGDDAVLVQLALAARD